MSYRTLPRLQSFDYLGKFWYFVTCCTLEKRELFTTRERVECVRTHLLHTAMEKEFAVPAGVFMPDHLHLLLEGLSTTCDFKHFMTLMRKRSAVAYKRQFSDRLWQKGYHDRVLRNVDEVPGVIRYIERNPVEAGLVENPEDYPYLWTPSLTYGASEFSRTSALVTPD